MGWFRKKKEKQKKQSQRGFNKPDRYIEATHLHPYYWRCVVCQQQAAIAYFPGVFQIAIKNENFFKDLTPESRQTITALVDQVRGEAILENAEGYEQFKDTYGWTRNRTGSAFYAVFLCEDHYKESSQAVQASAK